MSEPERLPPIARPLAAHLRTHDRSRAETIFLGSIVAGSLLATIAFLILASRGIFAPAMGIAIVAAIGVATLVYAFLGGQGDSFNVQGMKLAGAAAVFAIVTYIVDSRLDTQIAKLIDQQSGHANAQLLLGEDVGPQPILGGGSVRLREVSTLSGWLEGGPVADGDTYRATHGQHEANRLRHDAAQVFTAIFSKESIHRPVSDVLNMSQQEWEDFLRSLPETKRNAVGGIPFAVIETRASDLPTVKTTVFKGDDLVVRNSRNQIEAVLCVQRILDTRTRSGEPEVVIMSQGTRPCSADS